MKQITDDLYKKLANVTDKVKKEFYQKGIVVPAKTRNGQVRIGPYNIVKNYNNYSIIDVKGNVEVSGINLPQTAAVVANNMALGKHRGIELIETDRRFGYAEFEEELHTLAVKNSKSKSLDYFEMHQEKAQIARRKKEFYKKVIDSSFEKLAKLA